MPGVLVKEQSLNVPVVHVKRPAHGESLYRYVYEKPSGVKQAGNGVMEAYPTVITDMRTVGEPFTLERQGFKLVNFDVPPHLDWKEREQIKAQYYPLIEELLLRETGASRAFVFDHTTRDGSARKDGPTGKQAMDKAVGKDVPVVRAHVDFTVDSGPARLKKVLPEEAERLSKTPYAIIQAWRPLAGPVDDSPLALADASTVPFEDLMPATLHFPGRTGHVYAVERNPAHRWYYAKGINVDEMYLFTCFHSRTDGCARFTPHTAFVDPSTKPDAPPRRSIETRAFVFWENETA